jgi:histone H3/H4
MIEAAVMAELVVKSAVKERLDSMNVSTDLYDALDREVDDILQAAAQRAEDNDRKTVQPRDL